MPKLEMDSPRTTNPAGNTVYHVFSVRAPAPAAVKKQDSKRTKADYSSDLEKVTQRRRAKSS